MYGVVMRRNGSDAAAKWLKEKDEQTFENRLRRLMFLLNEWEKGVDFFVSATASVYFEEARHTFLNGDFTSCIVMSAMALEEFLRSIYREAGKNDVARSKIIGFGRLIEQARKDNLINENEYSDLKRLNNLRVRYVHPKDWDVAADLWPQYDDKLTGDEEGAQKVLRLFVEEDAQKALRYLFRFVERRWGV